MYSETNLKKKTIIFILVKIFLKTTYKIIVNMTYILLFRCILPKYIFFIFS